MKKLFWLIFIIFLFAGCQKENSRKTNQNTPSIVGQWEWISSFGALSPRITPQNSGLTWNLKFNSDSTCNQTGTRFSNLTATYSLKVFNSGFPVPPGWYWLNCSLLPITKNFYIIKSADTLQFTDLYTAQGLDGPVHTFLRK